ncbi:PREDICTED: uncharacterized protein LOC109210936 [Nicotiana attenuata]|uniref:uncharacterized protein LOC109210936 n=1 Tax=Nicotiana attenuata TaxID=49451 RepID=UPI00090540EA|nr:PREDICTED: uncharacterized protein LOC109210936 [Nicotiana attenuata]
MDVLQSTLHQVIKFPSQWGIRKIRRDQQASRSINSVGATSTLNDVAGIPALTDVDSRLDVIQESVENEYIKTTAEELEAVVLFIHWPDIKVYIRANLSTEMKANGQAEATNKVIINNLKKRLEESNGKWPEVLPGILWAYRTIAKTSTGKTPFSLVYGTEALIPIEIGEPSTRYTHATEESNEEEMQTNMDLVEERREEIESEVFRSTKAANAGKLSPNWEGPYRVRGITGKGAYELETMDGSILPSNWNDVHLKKYYF